MANGKIATTKIMWKSLLNTYCFKWKRKDENTIEYIVESALLYIRLNSSALRAKILIMDFDLELLSKKNSFFSHSISLSPPFSFTPPAHPFSLSVWRDCVCEKYLWIIWNNNEKMRTKSKRPKPFETYNILYAYTIVNVTAAAATTTSTIWKRARKK